MTTYFIVLSIVVAFCFLAEKSCKTAIAADKTVLRTATKDTKVFLFVVVVALTVTAGCRYHVGTDYGNYIILYRKYASATFGELIGITKEPILPVIGKLSARYFDSYYPMFFAASVITVALALKSTYQDTTDYVFVTLLYALSGSWVGSFNGVRQFMAITIVYMGRKYIYQRKFLKFLAVCFVGFLAHKSALFFVLVYFVYTEKITGKRLFAIAVITVILSRSYEQIFSFIGWVSDSENSGTTDYAMTSVNIFRILVSCAPAIVGIYYAYTRKMNKEQVFYVYMMVANAAIWLATSDSAYLARLGSFTGIFVPLALSSITQLCDKRYYAALRVVIVCLYFLYWLYEVTNSRTLYEFEWIFSYI